MLEKSENSNEESSLCNREKNAFWMIQLTSHCMRYMCVRACVRVRTIMPVCMG